MSSVTPNTRESGDKPIVLTNKEAARELGVSHRTLEDWRQTNRGPRVVRLGRLVRYRLSDLLDFIERNTSQATAA